MSLKKKLHPLSPKQFTGSVELIPPPPQFVEFIDSERLWGFPMRQLEQFVLEENPHHEDKRTSPPHQLLLVYPEALVFLRGWRLEQMIRGRVPRGEGPVHAAEQLGTLIL